MDYLSKASYVQMITKTDPDIIKGFLEDSSNLPGGHCQGVYIPENEKELIEIVKECSLIKRPLTVSGAGTGTVGGRIPFGGWVLSTEKLNKIIDIDVKNKRAIFQPGITIEEIEKALEKEGLMYAPDPTEKTAFLGGTVATNASGAHSLRFGSTREHIHRLKAVSSQKHVLDIPRGQKYKFPPSILVPDVKTSAGYYLKPYMDLIDLFIGSEGTLGVISEIEVNLIERPKRTFNCLAFISSEEAALVFVKDLLLKEDVLCLEYFDSNTLELLRSSYPNLPAPPKTAVYIEQDIEKHENYLDFWEHHFKKYNVSMEDAWSGEALSQFRHAVPERINELYKEYKQQKVSLDIAVPPHKFREMLKLYNTNLLESGLSYVKFGHIGESHLHVNILPKSEQERVKAEELTTLFVTRAVSMRGTVSAEHGIGKIKHHFLYEMYHEGGILSMIQIKKKFDPALIFGLGNIFPRELLRR